jgi:pimeloyl-ACP methyl ester carboxylesterase
LAIFVFVAGACHGAWCWERVIPLLRAEGHGIINEDLPGMGADHTPLAEVSPDIWAQRVADNVSAQSEPVILVGHSRGGLQIAQAAEYVPDRVAMAVYIAALLIPSGRRVEETMVRVPPEQDIRSACIVSADGVSMTLSPEIVRPAFYNTTQSPWVERAVSLLTAEPVNSTAAPLALTDGNFGRVPRAYIECLQDRAVSIALQRLMQEDLPCLHVMTMDTDHSPFYSAPEELAAHLITIAGMRA